MSFLRGFPRLRGMLHGLAGELVPRQMVSSAMIRRRSAMCVRGEFVQFSGSLVKALRHLSVS